MFCLECESNYTIDKTLNSVVIDESLTILMILFYVPLYFFDNKKEVKVALVKNWEITFLLSGSMELCTVF